MPKLAGMLPGRAIETLLIAVELDELAENLDAEMAQIVELPLTRARYAEAYPKVGNMQQRTRQIELVNEIGRALNRLARIPMLSPLLAMMKGPAESWGYGNLHHFLYRGFHSFVAMGRAADFLATIKRRETAINARLFARERDPFRPVD